MKNDVQLMLCGDVGGTNSRFQLFGVDVSSATFSTALPSGCTAPGTLLHSQQYQNVDFSTFVDVVIAFLAEAGQPVAPRVACIAVAGPVKGNAVHLTNRDWAISGEALQSELGIAKVVLCNDFLAQGYGLLTLDEARECVPLHDAQVTRKTPGGPIACIGAGTGLGECYLTAHDASAGKGRGEAEYEYQCWPCEGGHAEFSPRSDIEYDTCLCLCICLNLCLCLCLCMCLCFNL